MNKKLEKEGAICEPASGGTEALKLATSKEFDLMFVSVLMPRMDGYETAMQIRKFERTQPSGKRLPIIGVTAGEIEGIHNKCKGAGMDGVVTKPLTFPSLAEDVAWILFGRASKVSSSPSIMKREKRKMKNEMDPSKKNLTNSNTRERRRILC